MKNNFIFHHNFDGPFRCPFQNITNYIITSIKNIFLKRVLVSKIDIDRNISIVKLKALYIYINNKCRYIIEKTILYICI